MTDASGEPPTAQPAAEGPEDAQTGSLDEVLAATEGTGDAVRQTTDDDESAGRPLALDTDAANALAARRRPTVVVLAGRNESGKTSVYAAIYERLGRGPFAGWLFAGSNTLSGFESRCHLWRKASNAGVPEMEHTQATDLPWLHLRLTDVEKTMSARDYLFGDFDGEFFRELLRNVKQPSELPFLRRADHIGLVLDGERLADPGRRETEVTELEYLVGALSKPEAIAGPEVLSLVVTKLDLIDAIEDGTERAAIDEALDKAQSIVEQLTNSPVPVIRLAARSATDRYPLGHGLESLLERVSSHPATQVANELPPQPAGDAFAGFRA
jgi:hypothetical protein